MQIHGPAHIHGAQAINRPHQVGARRPAAPSGDVTGVDQLDISHEAELVSRARDLPEIRAERVATIREAIRAGEYETEAKLEIALERMLEEIGG